MAVNVRVSITVRTVSTRRVWDKLIRLMAVGETRARVSCARNGRGVRVRKTGTENGVKVIGVAIIQRPKMMMIMFTDIINLPFSSFLAHF